MSGGSVAEGWECGKIVQRYCSGRLAIEAARGARRKRFLLAYQAFARSRGIRIAKMRKTIAIRTEALYAIRGQRRPRQDLRGPSREMCRKGPRCGPYLISVNSRAIPEGCRHGRAAHRLQNEDGEDLFAAPQPIAAAVLAKAGSIAPGLRLI
jgi:hypothetical protein